MMPNFFYSLYRNSFISKKSIFLSFFLFISPAFSASTPWQQFEGASVRLWVVENQHNTQIVNAVLEIKLKDGWKTYWRNPGSSGISPQLKTNSNYQGKILFPTPHLNLYAGEYNYVYKNKILLPIIFSKNTEKKDNLSGMILFGLCKDICLVSQISFNFSSQDLKHQDLETYTIIKESQDALPKKETENFKVQSLVLKNNQIYSTLLYKIFARKREIPKKLSTTEIFFDGQNLTPNMLIGPSQAVSVKNIQKQKDFDLYEVTLKSSISDFLSQNKIRGKIYYTVRIGNQTIEGNRPIKILN